MDTKKKKEIYNHSIVQSNVLSQKINYFHDSALNEFNVLSPNEKKIVLYLCSLVQKDDREFCPLRIKCSELANIINYKIAGGKELNAFKHLLQHLASKNFWIPYGDNGIVCSPWIENPILENGYVQLQLNRHMGKYLLNISSPFTMFKYGYAVKLKHRYSIDLYIFFKSIQNAPSWTVDMNFFRQFIGSKYEKFSLLESRILQPVIEEINEKTDIVVDYQPHRNGRQVDHVCFSVSLLERPCIPA